MNLSDKVASAVAWAAARSPYGYFRIAKAGARFLPALRRFPVETRYGRIICDLGESVCLPLLREGEYAHWRADEEELTRLPLTATSVMVDIGANIGVMSRWFAPRVGQIHAFEPAPRAVALLRANCADLPNVTVHQLAISDRDGTVYFAQEDRLDVSHLADHGIEVQARTLDSFRFAPDFIKIDVEGFEHLVLKGSTETLRRHNPILLFEALDEDARQGCEAIILAANPNYRFKTLGGTTNHFALPTGGEKG